MQLATLQRLLGEALVDPRQEVSARLLEEIRQDRLSPGARLGIYQANALGALTRAIEKAYPVCLQILGEPYFAQLSRAYALQTKATSSDLDEYGDRFPEYLEVAIAQRDELQDFAYLADLSRLEWAIKHAWLAADSPEFDLAGFQTSLTRVPAEQHSLLTAPSLSLLSSDWPTDRLWRMHQDGEEPADLHAEGRIDLCICRHRDQVEPKRVSPSEKRVLALLLDGRALGVLSELAAGEGIALDSVLPQMIRNGWVCDYAVPESFERM